MINQYFIDIMFTIYYFKTYKSAKSGFEDKCIDLCCIYYSIFRLLFIWFC